MTDNEKENWIPQVYKLEELTYILYSHSSGAMKALRNYEGDIRYLISLGFYQMAQQTYLSIFDFYNGNDDLERGEYDQLLEAFQSFERELTSFISTKDDNSSWLESQFDAYKKEHRVYIEMVKELREQRRMINKAT